jgi:uroporphyrinogen-III synthase
MKSKTIAILETRVGEHLGELIERRGGIALLAPALEEVPDVDPNAVAALLKDARDRPIRMAVFQTGVGTRALFDATDSLGGTEELQRLLAAATVVVRGPKPAGELNSRQIRIDMRARSPFTTETVLEAVAGIPLDQAHVLVQRYGATNGPLRDALEARGAVVREIATYRWALPKDIAPLQALLDALDEARVDAVVFTSAVQIHNLHAVAAAEGRAGSLVARLRGLIVASIGPVCSRALMAYGITPSFEANPPKLGPLVDGLDQALRGAGNS